MSFEPSTVAVPTLSPKALDMKMSASTIKFAPQSDPYQGKHSLMAIYTCNYLSGFLQAICGGQVP
jgi:hypothetical protein